MYSTCVASFSKVPLNVNEGVNGEFLVDGYEIFPSADIYYRSVIKKISIINKIYF